jgi:hypothetical protein
MSRPQTIQSCLDDRSVSSQLMPFCTNSIDLNTKELCVKSARLVWKILCYILNRELPRLTAAGTLTEFQEHLDRLFEETRNSRQIVNHTTSILFDLLQNSESGINNLLREIEIDLASVKLCFIHFSRFYGIKVILKNPGKFSYRIPYQGEILMSLLGDISKDPLLLYSSFCVNRDKQINYQIYPHLVSWTNTVLKQKLLVSSRSHRSELPPGSGWTDLYFLYKEPWDSRKDKWTGIKFALQERIKCGNLELESYKVLIFVFKKYYETLSPKPKVLTAEHRQEIESRYQKKMIETGYLLLLITWQPIGDKLEKIAEIVRRYYSSPTRPLAQLENRASELQLDVEESIEAMHGEDSQPDDSDPPYNRVKQMLLQVVGEYLDRLKTKDRERIEYRFKDRKKLPEIASILNLKHYHTISNTIDKVQCQLTILFRKKFSQNDSPEIINFINRHLSIFSPHLGFELTAQDISTIKKSRQIFEAILESYYEAVLR